MSDNTGDKDRSGVGEYIRCPGWAPEVRCALDRFIAKNGSASPGYDPTVYTVFDFDNTVSIFDVEHQLVVYQLQRMAFAVSPDKMTDTLLMSLSDPDEDLSYLGFGRGGYRDWAEDISAAYARLYEAYGPFTPAGLSDAETERIRLDPWWLEFAAKMRALFNLVHKREPLAAAASWTANRFCGMTEREVYDLAYASHSYYSKRETSLETWRSPEGIGSRTGRVEAAWTSGIRVTDEIMELMRAFRDNGIHVWICSASGIDVVRAAVDRFGLHDCVTGLLAMTSGKVGEKYTCSDDGAESHGRLCEPGGAWTVDPYPLNAITKGAGKVTAIENALRSRYGHGPAAGFMDNSGDFNFCTVYRSLQLVVCFNAAGLPFNDGGTLIGELALYQRDTLRYDLDRANAAGDTLYVLQGRDENGLRTLRPSNLTVKAGDTAEQAFPRGDSVARLRYINDSGLSTEEIIDTFAITTPPDAPGNPLRGIGYGLLKEYGGYHSLS